jgi:hypothetical protein
MFKSITAIALAALFCCTWADAQQNNVTIGAVAAHDGYSMQWLLPERSVSLSRPGLAIVVRPGAVMYFVNSRVEFTDTPPRYVNGDIVISSTLAARLDKLARQAAAMQRQRFEAPGLRVSNEPQASGPITMDVRPQPNSEAVSVTGHAPSTAPVTITLLATFSYDVPTVIVSRHDVQPDVNGNFSAEVSIAPSFARGTVLRVLATSVAGTTPASAQLVVGSPNSGLNLPLDRWPNDP